MPERLSRAFYGRATLTVAREILGQRLVRQWQGERLAGRIVEVEAYIGLEDCASHAHRGKTERNAAMFGRSGHAYVYFIYGMYHCLNLVTETEGYPAALLIRALEPLEGLNTQQQLRGIQRPFRELTRGPGRLCQALAIDKRLNGADLCAAAAELWVEYDQHSAGEQLAQSPRIGVRGDAQALTTPWRFFIRDNPWVSRAPGGARLNIIR